MTTVSFIGSDIVNSQPFADRVLRDPHHRQSALSSHRCDWLPGHIRRTLISADAMSGDRSPRPVSIVSAISAVVAKISPEFRPRPRFCLLHIVNYCV